MPNARSAFTIIVYDGQFLLAGDSPSVDLFNPFTNSYSSCDF